MKSVELIISKVIQYKNGFVKDYAFINKETNTYNNLKEEIKKNIKSQLKDFRQKRLSINVETMWLDLLKIYLIIQYINKRNLLQ